MPQQKKIGLISAIGLGVSSILGSGWLFAPYQAAKVPGPAALFSWLIAAIIVCLLGLCYAEIAGLYPKRGLSAIIPILSHDRYFAFPFAIANWLGVVAVIGLEADAVNQYLTNLSPSLRPMLFHHSQLTLIGNTLSILLVIIFGLLNFWGAKTLIKANNILTAMKVVIPIFIGLIILFVSFKPHNFYAVNHQFMPYGSHSILTAILTCGIVVAFNGFQTVIAFANEIKDPGRTIPLAVVSAVALCLTIYLILQTALISAIPSQQLAHGWHELRLYAPMIQVMGFVGLGFLSSIAYFGATIAPVGCGVAFTGTASRMFTAMSANKQMPAFFKVVHPVYGISRRSLALNIGLSIAFLLIFKSWKSLAEVLGLLHVISYLPVPIALWALRGKIRAGDYAFRLPGGQIISFCLFLFYTYLFTLADLAITLKVMAIFAGFFTIYLITVSRNIQHIVQIIKRIWFLLLYFIALTILTIIVPSTKHHIITEYQHMSLVTLLTICFFICFLKTARSDIPLAGLSLIKRRKTTARLSDEAACDGHKKTSPAAK